MSNNPSKTPNRAAPAAGNFYTIPINRTACWSYFFATYKLSSIALAILPLWLIFHIWNEITKSFAGPLYLTMGLFIFSFIFFLFLSARQSAALNYRVEGRTLRVDWGVFFLKRKAIPLDRITDFALVQGPLMRIFGVWAMRVQTAGTGSAVPEATLYAIINPEQVRDELIRRRDEAAVDSNYPG